MSFSARPGRSWNYRRCGLRKVHAGAGVLGEFPYRGSIRFGGRELRTWRFRRW